MAKTLNITFGEEVSVKIAEFQYVKPYINITVQVDDGEDSEAVLEAAKHKVRTWIKRASKEAKELYKPQR